MRRRFVARIFLALVTVTALSATLTHAGSAQGADGGGNFIVRCFYNGNVSTNDPIDAPGSANSDHMHAFFGNMASGSFAVNGSTQVPFYNMLAGDDGSAGTMESNGLPLATNCQDSKDTAGYWVPEPFMVPPPPGSPSAYLPGNGCSNNCSISKNLYMRVYYIPHGDNTTNQEIPDGTTMIAGYPAGCANIDGTEPAGCAAGGPSYPNDLQIVEYSCGADSADGLGTPHSAWPYDCTKYTDADDGFFDGVVAFVNFPDCWNGQSDFPAPNSPANAQGLPTKLVPGYVAPWIPYPSAQIQQKYPGLTGRPTNDFYYSTTGSCGSGTPVVQLEERMHLLTNGKGWGEPSTCTGDSGIAWNTIGNVENSPSGGTSPSDTAETFEGNSNNDNDATVKVGTTSTGTAIWGFHKCVAASVPSPNATASTLSFACTHGADPNCTEDIGVPSTTTGCSSVGGHCYAGAHPDGWETLHADYWQTWQEAKHALDSQSGSTDVSSDSGTFGDVVEDCVQGTGPTCSPEFVTNTGPPEVYGASGNP